MSAISSNIANVSTTRTPEGGPYQRQELICREDTCDVIKAQNFVSKFEPGHPDADDSGFVRYPEIDLAVEMSNLVELAHDYEEIVANCNGSNHK